MKNIETRLSELEITIRGKNKIPVLIVDENEDGIYTFNGQNFTREQLDQFCIDRCVETLIIDDIRRVEREA